MNEIKTDAIALILEGDTGLNVVGAILRIWLNSKKPEYRTFHMSDALTFSDETYDGLKQKLLGAHAFRFLEFSNAGI